MINYSDEYIDMLLNEFYRVTRATNSENDGLRAFLTKHEEQQAINWETDCPNCRRLLDELYRRDVEAGSV